MVSDLEEAGFGTEERATTVRHCASHWLDHNSFAQTGGDAGWCAKKHHGYKNPELS